MEKNIEFMQKDHVAIYQLWKNGTTYNVKL